MMIMIRKSPVEHEVGSYRRKDGTFVDSYIRGCGRPRSRRSKVVGNSSADERKILEYMKRGHNERGVSLCGWEYVNGRTFSVSTARSMVKGTVVPKDYIDRLVTLGYLRLGRDPYRLYEEGTFEEKPEIYGFSFTDRGRRKFGLEKFVLD